MMNENDNGSLLGSIVLGVGFAGMLLLPFYIVQRFGGRAVAIVGAIFFTVLAGFSADLVALASEFQNCGYGCAAAPGANLILAIDRFGWWLLAGLAWGNLLLMELAGAVLGRRGAEHG